MGQCLSKIWSVWHDYRSSLPHVFKDTLSVGKTFQLVPLS